MTKFWDNNKTARTKICLADRPVPGDNPASFGTLGLLFYFNGAAASPTNLPSV